MDMRNALLFFLRDGLEVAVHLFLIFSRSPVVGAGGETFLRLLRLNLFAQRGLDVLECLRRLTPHLFPLRVVLLEGFGARSRERHPLSLERESAAAAREGLAAGILLAQFVEELTRFVQCARV